MTSAPDAPINRLIEIMALLRDPDKGCPWDVEQTFATIAPHTLEEAFEVVDAIEHGDMAHLKEELGDLVFQVAFYAQMANEAGDFDFADVCTAINDKMVYRHPHVFGDANIETATAQTENWEKLKEKERAAKANAKGSPDDGPQGASSALDGVTRALPALLRAYKLQKRAARVGFDWPNAEPVFEKFDEELEEIHAEIKSGDDAALATEVGDLLFTCVNLARKLGCDPETELRHANGRFEARFRAMESGLKADGQRMEATPLDELEALWQRAKESIKQD